VLQPNFFVKEVWVEAAYANKPTNAGVNPCVVVWHVVLVVRNERIAPLYSVSSPS